MKGGGRVKKRHLKKLSILFIAVLISSAAAASVLALFLKSTNRVDNTFTAAVSENPVISEKFTDNVKEDVCIEISDKGYPVYVRCAIVINWKDNDGNLLIENPVENVDYILETGADWTKNDDGFYYYNSPVQSGTTTPLIVKCEQKGDSPDAAYNLSVNIISQTIQSVGSTDEDDIPAHQDGWNINLN